MADINWDNIFGKIISIQAVIALAISTTLGVLVKHVTVEDYNNVETLCLILVFLLIAYSFSIIDKWFPWIWQKVIDYKNLTRNTAIVSYPKGDSDGQSKT